MCACTCGKVGVVPKVETRTVGLAAHTAGHKQPVSATVPSPVPHIAVTSRWTGRLAPSAGVSARRRWLTANSKAAHSHAGPTIPRDGRASTKRVNHHVGAGARAEVPEDAAVLHNQGHSRCRKQTACPLGYVSVASKPTQKVCSGGPHRGECLRLHTEPGASEGSTPSVDTMQDRWLGRIQVWPARSHRRCQSGT